jgi:hypothetical protein
MTVNSMGLLRRKSTPRPRNPANGDGNDRCGVTGSCFIRGEPLGQNGKISPRQNPAQDG